MTSYYDTTILADNPTGYWHINETSGTTGIDSTTNHYNGAYSSGITYSQAGAINGDPDTSIGFTGSAYFAFPYTLNIQAYTALSIELWIKQTGLWEHVVITANASTISYFLDGVAYVSGAGDPVLVSQDFSFVGSYNNGNMAKIAVYNYVLSSAQIQKHYLVGQAVLNGGAALMANGTGTAQFDNFQVTFYPDPTQRLTSAGRAVNSISDHNSSVPTNTRVDVLTSVDGGATYQPIANPGDYIPTVSTAAYYAAVRANGPLAFYRLNEQSGTVAYDSSNNGNTGTLNGGITFAQTGMLQGLNESGDAGMLFNGTNSYINVPTSIVPTGAHVWSLECLCKISSIPAAGNYGIVAMGQNSNQQSGQIKLKSDGTNAQFVLGTFNGSVIGPNIALNTTYHLVGTYDATNIRLHQNGVLVAGPAPFTLNLVATYALIGADGSPASEFFPGTIQCAAFYNVLLAAGDVTNHYNAATQATQSMYSDTFGTDTHTSYTQTFGTGGAGATWSWDVANSRVIASGGSRALLIYNTFTAGDQDMLIDLLQAQNAGMVWRYANASNYYELVVKDSANGNSYTLNKMASGTLTQLATASISFTTNTHHRARVTMLSGVITAYFDGTQILTYTDGSPLSAGQWGLRNDTGTSYTYLLTNTPQAANISNLAIFTKHILTSNDPTVTPQILDAHVMASDSTFGLGASMPSADYNQKFVSDNIDDANVQSNYQYKIDFNKSVTFTARNSANAPWILQSSDVQIAAHSVEYSGDLYRNRQTFTGVYQTATYNEIKIGNNSTRTWNTANPIVSAPTITLNNLPATVGVLNVDSGRQFYYEKGSTAITQDNSQTILTSASSFTIVYTGTSGINFSVDNTGQFSGTLSQSQMAALDGSTGVIEAIEDVSQKNMDIVAATIYANQLLQRYGSIARTIKGTTLHAGLQVGQDIPVFIPELNIFDSFFLVVELKISERFLNGVPTLVYDFVISEAAALSSWIKAFSKIMRSV